MLKNCKKMMRTLQ